MTLTGGWCLSATTLLPRRGVFALTFHVVPLSALFEVA